MCREIIEDAFEVKIIYAKEVTVERKKEKKENEREVRKGFSHDINLTEAKYRDKKRGVCVCVWGGGGG